MVEAPSSEGRTLSRWPERVATITGRVIVVAGLWSLVSLALRRVHEARKVDQVIGILNVPVGPSLFSVTLLLILGGALQRRKRVALWVLFAFELLAAVTVLGVSISAIATHNAFTDATAEQWTLLIASGLFAVVAVPVLFRSRRAFPSRLQPGALWRAIAVLIVGLAASAAVAVALTFSFHGNLHTTSRKLIWALRVVLGREPDPDDPGWYGEHGPHWVAVLIGLCSALALVAATVVFLRSVNTASDLDGPDELDLRALLLRDGERDSLGYFATRRDKAVIFAGDRRAAVTYRVVASVSLASADPIGARESWKPAIEAWLARSRQYGWLPAVLAASAEGAKAYTDAGLKALPIGDEAVIDVKTFTLDGATMQPVRRAVNRVRRAGYTITAVRHAELSDAQLSEIIQRAEDWRGDDTERGFSMALSRLGDRADGRCVAVLAHDGDNVLRGVLSFVPWGSRGLSLDLMRRDRTSENGLMEAMVAATVETGDQLGIERVSLNFAMFRGVFSAAQRVGAGPLVRAANWALVYASRFWQLETLYRSNARYLPRWEPRYLCYDSSLTLTRVAIAAGMAEGFLPAPFSHPTPPPPLVVNFEGREQVPFIEAVQAQEEASRDALPPARRLNEQERVRRHKIELLRAAGQSPYPISVPRTDSIAHVRARAGAAPVAGSGSTAAMVPTSDNVSIAGRVRVIRDFGGLSFVVLQEAGSFVQAALRRDALGPAVYDLFRRTVDVGDQLSVTGSVGTSDKGELTVFATGWQMAAKSLHPLPDLRTGLADPETRMRQRHLDLIANPDALKMINQRSVAVRALREGLVARGFVEVETPMLQAVHGGATARPFKTHINAYNTDLSLRIAPELFLKRLAVGGMGRVFELNRNFRNEGADATHNPEFTSVEAYQAYADYNVMRVMARELIIEMAHAVYGAPIARRSVAGGGETVVDLSGEWPIVTVHDAVSKAVGHLITPDTSRVELAGLCAEHDISIRAEATPGELVVELYDELVEKQTLEPTFYTDFPIETSPLTRAHRVDPRLSERWDLVAFGAELGTAYTELTDPIDQRDRLVRQSLKAANGDVEAMQVDEAFLGALEYGMPPTGGIGLGVDRLVMMLTGTSIRQTLAFPFVKPTAAR